MEDESYVCPFDEETQAFVKEELREDAEIRENALKEMRLWISKNPRIINCRTDASFLLRFLRAKKFSLPMAQETFERYVLLRKTYRNMVFKDLDCTDPVIEDLINKGVVFPTPKRDHKGRRMIIVRPGAFDPTKYTSEDLMRLGAITGETLLEDERNQAVGFVYVGDGAGVTLPHLSLFTPREVIRIVKMGEHVIPVRHKEIHILNLPPAFKYVLDFGLSLTSEKIRARAKTYNKIDEMYDVVDKSLLPKEYGGEMPMQKMIDLWKKEMLSKRELVLSSNKVNLRLEMYTEAAKEGRLASMKGGLTITPEWDVMSGSFRQLAVD